MLALAISEPHSLSKSVTVSTFRCCKAILAKIPQGDISSNLSFQSAQYQWEICHGGI